MRLILCEADAAEYNAWCVTGLRLHKCVAALSPVYCLLEVNRDNLSDNTSFKNNRLGQ